MTKGAKFGAVDFADDGGAFTYEGIEGQIQGNIDVAFPGGVRVGAAVNFGARPDGRFQAERFRAAEGRQFTAA